MNSKIGYIIVCVLRTKGVKIWVFRWKDKQVYMFKKKKKVLYDMVLKF